MKLNKTYQGDTLEVLKSWPDEFVDTIITSPPYWGLRDYGVAGQIGLEPTLDEFLNKLLAITDELKRVLKPSGVVFWNHGDCYGGNISAPNQPKLGKRDPYKEIGGVGRNRGRVPKCLCLQNYRLILRMVDEQGWILRNSIVWHKPNAMPSSVKDRFSNNYEPVFMLTKNKRYWFDLDAVRVAHKGPAHGRGKNPTIIKGTTSLTASKAKKEGGWNELPAVNNPAGKNPGDVWKIPTHPFPEAHFATFPPKLIEPMVKAGCPAQVCKGCGKARVRITKTTYKKRAVRKATEKRMGATDGVRPEMPFMGDVEHITKGWTDCGCNKGWEAGIVLDPFMGAGTTALVARKHARNYLGIELNAEYIKIAEERLKQQTLGI